MAVYARPLLRDALLYRLRLALLPSRPDDQFLAAFPRSGSTWLRTVITNVMVPDTASNPKVFNARIPGITFRKLRHLYALPSPRLMMTHSPALPAFRRVVYIVRDGRDALVSYYHYVVTRQGGDEPFDVFFERYLKGHYGTPWHAHVEGWLGPGADRLGDDLLVVTFEQLKRDTTAEVSRVLRFLGVEASDETLDEAIRLASLDNAQRLEAQRRGPFANRDASFYRSGGTGTGTSLLTGEPLARFEAVSARALEMAGYPRER